MGTPTADTTTYCNLIDGDWVPSVSGELFENRNPANTDDLIGLFQKSTAADVARAIDAARRAYDHWRLVPAPKRAEILFRAAQLLADRKEALARDMTREMGKVLDETRGDVQEAIDMTFFMAGEGRRQYGQTVPSELRDKFAMSIRQPVGVSAIITPWNFPMAIPSWKIIPALVCGNTVVFKPATLTPLSALHFVSILAEAGIPRGVVNFITGGGAEVGNALLVSDAVRVVSFTGSTEVGRTVSAQAAPSFKKVHLEMGGKNVIMIMDDANLELAVEGCLWGGFGTSGQRCTAASRVVVHEKLYQPFLEQFVTRAKALRVGDGLDPATQMGPSVSRGQLETVMEYVEIGQKEGASERILSRADDLRGRGARHADCAGGDLRPGRVRNPMHVVRGRGRRRQRRTIRALGVDIHSGRQSRVRRHAGHEHWNLLRQRADHWRGSPLAVRRHEVDGQRSPRGGHGGARCVFGVEVGVRGLQR
jgi:aldehyde dehydrogenase (NAD+)